MDEPFWLTAMKKKIQGVHQSVSTKRGRVVPKGNKDVNKTINLNQRVSILLEDDN